MAYRKDKDIEFIAHASNEDLKLLADTLVYKDFTYDNKHKKRVAATLHRADKYKRYYPNHMFMLWQDIAEEIQKFGGHSGVNLIFRGNKGVLYRDIVIDVCKNMKIKGIKYSGLTTPEIEDIFIEKFIEMAIQEMSEDQIKELLKGLRCDKNINEHIKDLVFSKDTLLAIVKLAFKKGGFTSYILTLQVVNGVSKAICGRGLTFAANAALMKYIASFMTGGLGIAITAITTVWGFLGANKQVELLTVTLISYMRKKQSLNIN